MAVRLLILLCVMEFLGLDIIWEPAAESLSEALTLAVVPVMELRVVLLYYCKLFSDFIVATGCWVFSYVSKF